ncbi:hypothetical protein PsYK624_158250 [Phanerochaete sordida]|uniref:Uncharacterized protein n=1 Tax=Phanerochaete sordida TaxID=48140 RepID=A0A9P3GPM4_9APHY|nr:hypothetical protein PsYK624_158250 [Phanerochaete sordida]
MAHSVVLPILDRIHRLGSTWFASSDSARAREGNQNRQPRLLNIPDMLRLSLPAWLRTRPDSPSDLCIPLDHTVQPERRVRALAPPSRTLDPARGRP